jgi:hypothetical protein
VPHLGIPRTTIFAGGVGAGDGAGVGAEANHSAAAEVGSASWETWE